MAAKLAPVPPGEILLEEFLKPLNVSQNQLARAIDVPPGRINDIIHARRSITADSAARFSIFFGTSPDFWLNLQARYERRQDRSAGTHPKHVKTHSIAHLIRGVAPHNAQEALSHTNRSGVLKHALLH
jgi:antitoxin HigA-1